MCVFQDVIDFHQEALPGTGQHVLVSHLALETMTVIAPPSHPVEPGAF
jgi:hypothetical protein